MNKVTVGAIVVILLLFGGLVAWSSLTSGDKINYDAYDSAKVIAAGKDNGNISDHVRGKEDSKVVLVEYADLQCPGCATMMPKITKLHEQYGDRVAFIFRSFPINGHQNARAASAAAEAAGLQGYFWQLLETAYDNRMDWISVTDTEKRTSIFVGYFETISDGKGDVNKFKSDLGSSDIQKKIDFDKGLGKKDGVTATPSFYINGKAIDLGSGGDAAEKIENAINDALKEAGIETGAKKTESDSNE